MQNRTVAPTILMMFLLATCRLSAITLYEYHKDNVRLVFFNKSIAENIPHIIRMYEEGMSYHKGIWSIDSIAPVGNGTLQTPVILFKDGGDIGNGGVGSVPRNMISIEVSPLNFSYFINPAIERYHYLFQHENTHVVMYDKTSASDRKWRTLLGGKFKDDPTHPFSIYWGLKCCPRRFAPSWYHEGIACSMETWISGGVGRALGGYDEMYFRSIVDSGDDLYSVVGLETEGTSEDFQGASNSYLYGTRFVNYLELKYGLDSLKAFYNRTDDSKALVSRQFRNVYGKSIRDAWNEWREFEVIHQNEQLAKVSQYPLTETESLTEQALGSMSSMVFDIEHNCAYAGVLYPGDFAHIERIDLNTLQRTKLHKIDGASVYQPCFLTIDTKGQRLVWTTQNGKYRGLNVYDIEKDRIVKKLTLQRVFSIVYDNVRDCMYGLMISNGAEYLCRYDSSFEKRDILYSFPFGVNVFDIDVSNDGKYISATISEDDGGQKLIQFDVDGLENADLSYKTLFEAPDFNLGQFNYNPDDRSMIGSSYYTGVSNIWKLDLSNGDFSLLSNTRTGLFSPVQINDTLVYALEFERNGMRPVRFEPEAIEDANSVTMLGQMAYDARSEELEDIAVLKNPVRPISFGEVYDSIREYKPRLAFTGAFPEISGFSDRESWNNVTPVLGYNFTFQDPLGINSLKLSLGISPWSHNETRNQYHAQLVWKYMYWTANAGWNATSFYDLVGPARTSRNGWKAGIAYDRTRTLVPPVKHSYGFSVMAYGMTDALPLYQEIETSDVNSFQTASAYYEFSKTRNTLGYVMTESGIITGAKAYSYLADGKLFPSLEATCDLGFLVPVMRNTCFWLRSAIGQNFGDGNSIFGNSYFGGFGNNWLDYREANRYRNTTSFAGQDIDAITGHSYARLMGELSLKPIRYNDFGFMNLYPRYTQLNLFTTGLVANPWGGDMSKHANIGVQLNTEVVLFRYFKTTWSVGYARAFNIGTGTDSGDFLISLKLF